MRVEAIGLARSSSPENRHAAVNAIDKYLQDQILGIRLACEGQAAQPLAERQQLRKQAPEMTMAAPKHHK